MSKEYRIQFRSDGHVELYKKPITTIPGDMLVIATCDEILFKHYHANPTSLLNELLKMEWAIQQIKKDISEDNV